MGPGSWSLTTGRATSCRIEQALTTAGAHVARAVTGRRHRRSGPARRPGRRSGRAGDGPPARGRLHRADPRLDRRRSAVPRHLPRPPAAVRGQRRGRRRDPRASCPAAPSDSTVRPTLPAHRLEPGGPPEAAPGLRGHRAEDADFYFVHSYVGRPEGPSADEVILAETEHGSRFVLGGGPRPAAGRPVPPRAVRWQRPAAARERRQRARTAAPGLA